MNPHDSQLIIDISTHFDCDIHSHNLLLVASLASNIQVLPKNEHHHITNMALDGSMLDLMHTHCDRLKAIYHSHSGLRSFTRTS